MYVGGGGGGDEVAAPPVGPQRMTAVTADDGGYELIVDEPGTIRVMVDTADGRVRYPARTADVPDADAYTLELAYSLATVTGVVVDKDTEKPLAQARVFAGRTKPDPSAATGSSSAQAGEDGRFQIELEPGDYLFEASAPDYGMSDAEIKVGSDGASDLKFSLSRGLVISGKVVDVRGGGVGGLEVTATDTEHAPHGDRGYAQTLPDGTFRMGGLRDAAYRLVARSELGAFATRSRVTPSDKDVVLTLHRGGRVTVRVLGPDGQPVAGASASAEEAGTFVSTDGQGLAELMLPAGSTEIRVAKDKLEGKAVVNVAEGGTAAAEIKLAPATRVSGSP